MSEAPHSHALERAVPPGEAASTTVSPRERRMEIVASILMSIAVVATAYCAWQSGRWNGMQILRYAEASSLRLESAKADGAGDTLAAYDAQTFVQIAQAYLQGSRREAKQLADLFIRDEFRVYVDRWLALDPARNPAVPQSPFELTGYHNDEQRKAAEFETRALRKFNQAQRANQVADDYILATVFFATVLFFAGISSKFDAAQVRTGILAMASVGLTVAFVLMLRLPFL